MSSLNIVIVGLGVIGGSFAKALAMQKEYQVSVYGLDTNPQSLEQAYSDGIILNAENHSEAILKEADLVLLTLYPKALIPFLKKHQSRFKKRAILSDVTGIKGTIIDEVLAVLPPGVDFIFGHPMAGKESRGYGYSDGSVFEDANYLITPVEQNRQENLALFENLVESLGFKRVSYLDAKDHDRMIAYTSQLCHVLAVSLINSEDYNQETIRYIGDSFRDLTRIAKINEDLWAELFLSNRELLLERITNFEEQLQDMKDSLIYSKPDLLKDLFRKSTQRRRDLEWQDLKIKGGEFE